MPNEEEIEVKFYINHTRELINRLRAQGASLIQPRIHEYNLRYDTPGGDLKRAGQVLRLRQDVNAVVTFKGPGQVRDEVSARTEIEFQVNDFTAARHLLEALGYTVNIIYEKYRTVYDLDGVHVTLDEMPFGTFSEAEGPGGERIRSVAKKLGLDWEARATDSYMVLFARVKAARQLSFRDLTFANFTDMTVEPSDLGMRPAD